MAIRTILACASGGTASDGTVEIACQIAKRFQAHLEGFHVRLDAKELLVHAGVGFGATVAADWVEQIMGDAGAQATKTRASFAAAAARHGLAMVEAPPASGASAAWREETGYASRVVARRARFFDLAVLGRSDRVMDEPHSDTIEETLMHSGRPLLLAPARPPAVLGETVAFGWNGSAAAVHALTAALPFLVGARAVFVIAIGGHHERSAEAVIAYLAWRGVAAQLRTADAIPGVGPGEQLLAAARDEGADLLVMGGYGRTPWREMLFGGATREVVGTSLLPLLLSH